MFYRKKIYDIFVNIPCLNVSHMIPSSFQDFSYAKFYHDFTIQNSLAANSNYHQEKIKSFYSKIIKNEQYNVKAESVIPSSYAVQCDIVEHENKVIGISACDEATKGTFIPHKMVLSYPDIESVVFTTDKFVGFGESNELYFKRNMEKFSNIENTQTRLNVSHSETMNE